MFSPGCPHVLMCPPQPFIHHSLNFLSSFEMVIRRGSSGPQQTLNRRPRSSFGRSSAHTDSRVPEPPNILLVVDFSHYLSAEDFTDPDFDEDLMLNQVQLMTLNGTRDLERLTVEDLKKKARTWLWNPLGHCASTSQFVLILRTDGSIDPHWRGRRMLLSYQDTWKTVLTTWQIPESISVLNLELWHKNDVPVSRTFHSSNLNPTDNPSAAQFLRKSQTIERLNHIPTFRWRKRSPATAGCVCVCGPSQKK